MKDVQERFTLTSQCLLNDEHRRRRIQKNSARNNRDVASLEGIAPWTRRLVVNEKVPSSDQRIFSYRPVSLWAGCLVG